jgi:hypothetical protein
MLYIELVKRFTRVNKKRPLALMGQGAGARGYIARLRSIVACSISAAPCK